MIQARQLIEGEAARELLGETRPMRPDSFERSLHYRHGFRGDRSHQGVPLSQVPTDLLYQLAGPRHHDLLPETQLPLCRE